MQRLILTIIDGVELLSQTLAESSIKRQSKVIFITLEKKQKIAKNYVLGVKSTIRKTVIFKCFASSIEQMGIY